MIVKNILPDNDTSRKVFTVTAIVITAFAIGYTMYKGFIALLDIVNDKQISGADLLFIIVAYLILGFFKALFWHGLRNQERKEDEDEDTSSDS